MRLRLRPHPSRSPQASATAPLRPEAEAVAPIHEPRPGQRLVVSKSTSETIDAPRTAIARPPVTPPSGVPRPAAPPGSEAGATARGQRPGPRAVSLAPRAPVPPSAPPTSVAPPRRRARRRPQLPRSPSFSAPGGRGATSSAPTAVPLAPGGDHKMGAPRPVSPSGKPIPPPPGPRSISGRPIPPPPGARRPLPPGGTGSRPPAAGARPVAPGSRPGMNPSRPGAVGSRPPAGPSSEPTARIRHRLPALSGHFPPRDAGRPTGGGYGGGGAPGARAAATRPVVRRVQREAVLSVGDVRPNAGHAVAVATWRSSSRSR